jgi:hypothetical protein
VGPARADRLTAAAGAHATARRSLSPFAGLLAWPPSDPRARAGLPASALSRPFAFQPRDRRLNWRRIRQIDTQALVRALELPRPLGWPAWLQTLAGCRAIAARAAAAASSAGWLSDLSCRDVARRRRRCRA